MDINLHLEFSEEFLSDVLVTAFDGTYGGCWYWARPVSVPAAFEVDGDIWRSVAIVERESANGERCRRFIVNHALLVRGIERLFAAGVLTKRGDIRNAVLQQDAGNIDSEGADVLVQLACFGELVYG